MGGKKKWGEGDPVHDGRPWVASSGSQVYLEVQFGRECVLVFNGSPDHSFIHCPSLTLE